MIVLKFGGTSVQDANSMDQALKIAFSKLTEPALLVSSAMAKVTDSLIASYTTTITGRINDALKITEELRIRHLNLCNEFLTKSNLSSATKQINIYFDELNSIIKGCGLLKECSPQSIDTVLSFGELCSTTILYYRTKELNVDCKLIDSRDYIKTDNKFNEANVDMNLSYQNIKENLKPLLKKGRLIIAQGFIASNSDDITTTLGRGGSDYSAAIFGAGLNVSEIQIWTDVNGIMTTDPRIVPEAKTITEISYDEVAELSFFGAKVVHPATIQPAVEKKIPVTVLNTKDPDGIYTRITEKTEDKGLKAISGKKNISLITINSTRMLNAFGFLTRIFYVFEKHRISVDLISTSEVSVSMTINKTDKIDKIKEDLEKIGAVKIEDNKAILCLVGKDIWKDSKNVSKTFTALEGTKIRMISLGASDTNLSAIIPSEQLNDSIIKLHKTFFG